MIKRTLYFGNPVYLSTRNKQLLIQFMDKELESISVPIEDIGFIVLDNPQISVSNVLYTRLINNKVAIVHCDDRHMPVVIGQPLVGHSEQTERYRNQIEMSQPLKKNLWRQVIKQKIENESKLLSTVNGEYGRMIEMSNKVLSGDSSNQEAIAAAFYWDNIFPKDFDFYRDRHGPFPNQYLNYGYAILRAVVARAIVSSGMIPSLGIHHRNKYNPYCLADDLMEPYRVFIDEIVLDLIGEGLLEDEMNAAQKKYFLQIPAVDVLIDGRRKPLMNAVSQTTASLYSCITGEKRNLSLPYYESPSDT